MERCSWDLIRAERHLLAPGCMESGRIAYLGIRVSSYLHPADTFNVPCRLALARHLALSRGGEERVFVSQVLSAVSLAKAHNARGPRGLGGGGALCRDAEAERGVVHCVDDDAEVLGAVLGPAADVGLDDVAAVEKGHDAVGPQPNLVPRNGRQDGQGRDVQVELARLCEAACAGGGSVGVSCAVERGGGGVSAGGRTETDAARQELIASDRGG